jgi:hypothetical protein
VKRAKGMMMTDKIEYFAEPVDKKGFTGLTNFWQRAGDLIRDMGGLFRRVGFSYSDEAIGGYGSVHLYVAIKKD